MNQVIFSCSRSTYTSTLTDQSLEILAEDCTSGFSFRNLETQKFSQCQRVCALYQAAGSISQQMTWAVTENVYTVGIGRLPVPKSEVMPCFAHISICTCQMFLLHPDTLSLTLLCSGFHRKELSMNRALCTDIISILRSQDIVRT